MDTPDWFRDAIAVEPAQHTVDVDGCPVHYLSWGDRNAQPLVFIHGGAAHAHWWDHIAPQLLPEHRCLAIDLSGHGDSGRRESYPRERWAEEIMAVVRESGSKHPPILIGHSMGGLVAIIASVLHRERIAGLVIVDSGIRTPEQELERSQRKRRDRSFALRRIYTSLDEGAQRFRVMPRQPPTHPFLLDHIARLGLAPVEDGYQWKWDGRVFMRFSQKPMHEYLPEVQVPTAFIRGEHSLVVPTSAAAYTKTLLGEDALFIEIPDAHHHLFLDQPLAFVAALRRCIAMINTRGE